MLLELTLPGLTSGSAGHSHPGVPLTPRMTEPQAEWTDFSPKTNSPPDILTLSVARNFLIRQALVRPNPCSFPSLPPSGHELLGVAPRAAGEGPTQHTLRSAWRESPWAGLCPGYDSRRHSHSVGVDGLKEPPLCAGSAPLVIVLRLESQLLLSEITLRVCRRVRYIKINIFTIIYVFTYSHNFRAAETLPGLSLALFLGLKTGPGRQRELNKYLWN